MQITKKRLVSATEISLILSGRTILSKVNLTVSEGEIVTLIGPNGAGKSSLVKIVLGLLKPTHGEIDRQANIKVGYMPQRIKITPLMPLSVERFLKQHPFLKPEKIEETLEELGIMKLLHYSMQDLSGGELQRVLLARALLRNPDLLVLDEPVQGVDITGQSELYQLIVKIRNHRKCGILLVSHDLHLVMAGTDTVVCLNQHVCCSGHPQSVSQHPAFINLFGQTAIEGLAVYNHHHNHAHHLGGEVVNKEDPSCH